MKKIYLKGSVTKGSDGYYEIVASTASIDRQGDSIDQAGWDLTNFKQNPVLLWAHDYSEFPIGKVTEIAVIDGSLKAKFEFAPEDANPKAAQIQKLYEGGYVNASSVGLIPKERNGHVITRAELLELSLVPVPANQDALRLAVTSKSLDVSLIQKDFEKGAISDEMSAQEKFEKKWENYAKVMDICSAFYAVYFDENTAVEDFNKLVQETATLIGNLAPAGTSEEASTVVQEAINPDNTEKHFTAVIAKEGRRLSKKSLTLIEEASASMKSAITHLEHLITEDDQNGSDSKTAESKNEKKVDTDEEIVEVPLGDFLKSIQSHIRTSDKASEQANGLINTFLARRTK